MDGKKWTWTVGSRQNYKSPSNPEHMKIWVVYMKSWGIEKRSQKSKKIDRLIIAD